MGYVNVKQHTNNGIACEIKILMTLQNDMFEENMTRWLGFFKWHQDQESVVVVLINT